jgi:hypothetical protein
MSEELFLRTKPGTVLGIFLYAVAFHVAILRHYARGASSPSQSAFINHPLVNIIFPLIGGVFLTALILQLRRATRLWTGPGHSRTILLGGVFGVIATTFAFEAFYILLSLYATFFIPGEIPRPPDLHWTLLFEMYMLNIQTYGLIPIFDYGPIELLNGLMIGTWLVLTRVYSARSKSMETRL